MRIFLLEDLCGHGLDAEEVGTAGLEVVESLAERDQEVQLLTSDLLLPGRQL